MINYNEFDVIYADADEKALETVMLYGKSGDNFVYFKPEMNDSVKMEKVDLDNVLLKGAKISYEGSVYVPKTIDTTGVMTSVTFGDNITLKSAPMKPMATIISPDDSIDCLGKVASDLQEGVHVEGTSIYGTLHHITGYTGFSSIEDEQEGYYLATKYIPHPDDGDVHVFKTNGTVGDKILSRPDLTMISRITDKNSQKLRVYVEADGVTGDTVEYDLSNLVLEEDEL